MRSPHRDDGELDLLVDVLGSELDVAEVLFDVEGKLTVFVRLDEAFVVFQADDDALQPSNQNKDLMDHDVDASLTLRAVCFLSADLLPGLLSVAEG